MILHNHPSASHNKVKPKSMSSLGPIVIWCEYSLLLQSILLSKYDPPLILFHRHPHRVFPKASANPVWCTFAAHLFPQLRSTTCHSCPPCLWEGSLRRLGSLGESGEGSTWDLRVLPAPAAWVEKHKERRTGGEKRNAQDVGKVR